MKNFLEEVFALDMVGMEWSDDTVVLQREYKDKEREFLENLPETVQRGFEQLFMERIDLDAARERELFLAGARFLARLQKEIYLD